MIARNTEVAGFLFLQLQGNNNHFGVKSYRIQSVWMRDYQMAKNSKFKNVKQLGIFTLVVALIAAAVVTLSQFVEFDGEEYSKNIRVKVGEQFVIDVPGRTSIEYRWQINKEKSKGLELLEIDHIGWQYPLEESKKNKRSSFGTPRTAKFYIRPKAPGVTQLSLEYKKRGIIDDVPQRVRDFTIRVDP